MLGGEAPEWPGGKVRLRGLKISVSSSSCAAIWGVKCRGPLRREYPCAGTAVDEEPEAEEDEEAAGTVSEANPGKVPDGQRLLPPVDPWRHGRPTRQVQTEPAVPGAACGTSGTNSKPGAELGLLRSMSCPETEMNSFRRPGRQKVPEDISPRRAKRPNQIKEKTAQMH